MADQQQKYQSTGRVVVTVENRENKTEVVKKNIVKQLNEKTGKFETKTIEVPKQTIAQQIENTKAEINQADEISKKLAEQHKLLRDQVKSLKSLVAEKAKQFKKDEEDRKKKLMKMIKANDLEINVAARTPDQVNARLAELEKEFVSAKKVGEVLAKEKEMAKKQNEATEVTQQIQNLQLKLDEKKKQLKELKKQNSQFQRQDQQNQKKIDKMEQGTDDALQINILNKELTMLREKETKVKQKIEKTQKDIEGIQKTIESYIGAITKLQDEDKVEAQKKKFEEVNKEWEAKLQQLDEEETKQNMQLVKEMKEKKKEDKEKEKEKEKKDEDQDKKPKQVKDYIKEKRDVSKLSPDEPNFVQLFALQQQLDKQLKKLKKKIEVEKEQMESMNNNLKLEKANTQIVIKEKEREKEIAESLVAELREKLGERIKMEQELKEKAEKLKTTGRTQLSPLGNKDKRWEKTTTETLRARKDEQLKQFKEKFQKLPKEKGKLYLQEPFKLSYQEIQEKHKRKIMKQEDKEDKEKTEVKQLTIIETMCKTKHRGSKREWFGYEPNEQTTLCDDVHILGQFSIKHRIQKITVYHNPTEGYIYVIWTDYRKEDGNIISGSWNINQELLKNNKDIQKDELELSENDRIKQISLRRDNNYISFIQFQTKLGKQLKVGKEIIEKAEEDKPKEKEGEQQDKEKKDIEGGEKKEENPDRREIKLDNFSVLITLFSGYQQKGEKEVAMSFFGYEVGRKLTAEEYEQYLMEKKKRIEEKEKKDKLKRLEESMMSELNQSQLKKR